MILGKEGEQPFEIKQEGVSRKHAEITINGDDWTLEDLKSSNGTFIRDEDGRFVSLGNGGKCRISPMTFICLGPGPDNANSCCFYARQVLSPGDYITEYQYLLSKVDEYEAKKKKIENQIKKIRIAGPVFVVTSVFAITGIPFISQFLGEHALSIRIAMSSMSGLLPVLYDGSARIKRLDDEFEKWNHCPNPACSHKLTRKEIKKMKHTKCPE